MNSNKIDKNTTFNNNLNFSKKEKQKIFGQEELIKPIDKKKRKKKDN